MKTDTPDDQHNGIKLQGECKSPEDRDINQFILLIQRIVKRSRDNESSRLHQSINR